MTRKEIGISLAFAVSWTILMVLWTYQDMSASHVIILSITGLIIGFTWTWLMKRLGYRK